MVRTLKELYGIWHGLVEVRIAREGSYDIPHTSSPIILYLIIGWMLRNYWKISCVVSMVKELLKLDVRIVSIRVSSLPPPPKE